MQSQSHAPGLTEFHFGDDPATTSLTRRNRVYLFFRLMVERVLCLLLLLAGAPVILLCALLVKLSSRGPAFYSQVRLGRNGRPYRMYKLRTMPHLCEAETGPIWSTPDDPRVRGIGRFLRDTHLDELPQLCNVLTGEMSLIGPRPERPELVERIERALPRFRERLCIRPGMTGLAQMQLPPDSNLSSVRRKLAYDLHYVKHVGLWLDVRICISTFFYFIGVISNAMCREMIKSHRQAAEHRVETIEMIDDDETCEIGAS